MKDFKDQIHVCVTVTTHIHIRNEFWRDMRISHLLKHLPKTNDTNVGSHEEEQIQEVNKCVGLKHKYHQPAGRQTDFVWMRT